MSGAAPYVVGALMLGVIAALGYGLFNYAREGRDARRRSNRMMQARVALQFAAVVALLLFVFLFGGS